MTGTDGQPRKVGEVLDEVLSQKGYFLVCKEYAIVQKWSIIVDPSLAAVTSCEKIVNGVLFVKVKTAPWRQEAAYMKEAIVTKIQTELDCPTIKDIIFY